MDPEESPSSPNDPFVPDDVPLDDVPLDDVPLDDVALDRWITELRTEDAARSRSRVGAMKAHAAEDATVVGVLADLREREAQVLLTTTSGRRHRGQVLIVGPDALVLRTGSHEWLVTRIAAVASVRMVGGDPVNGEGSATTTSRFGRILGAAAQPGEWMRIAVGGEAFGGTVVATSAEVAVLRLDNGDLSYVNLDAVEEASLLSGER
jgi:hypothetical protein